MTLDNYEWSDRFPLSETQLEEWKKDPKKLPLLIWALNTGNIDPEQFKNWASKYYNLPKLKSKFLEQIEKPLVREYKHLLDLNVIPMRKNEGVLYAACIEPVKNLPIKEQVQFLVACADALQATIQNTKDNLDKPDEEEITENSLTPPDGIAIPKNIKVGTPLATDATNLPDGLNIKLTKNIKPNKNSNEAPEGLNIKPTSKLKKKQSVNLLQAEFPPDGLAIKPKFKKPDPKLDTPDMPDNIDIKKLKNTKSFVKDDVPDFSAKQKNPSKKAAPKITPKVSSDNLKTATSKPIKLKPKTKDTEKNSQASHTTKGNPTLTSAPKIEGQKIPPEPGQETIKPIKPKQTLGDVPKKDIESNVVPLKPKQASEAETPPVVDTPPVVETPLVKDLNLEDRKVEDAIEQNLPKVPENNVQRIKPISKKSDTEEVNLENLDPVFLENILRSLDSIFDNKVLFFVKEGKLTPAHWDKSFVPKSTNPLNTLDKPSIFRIAFKSRDKYFGEIYKNEVNDLFFDNWMGGQYPDRVTILALLNSDRVFGLFLGVHKVVDTTLDTLDVISKEIGQKLVSQLKAS